MVKRSGELLPLEERMANLKKLVERAYIFYTCWWLYEGAETRTRLLDRMQEHSEFYRFDSHAQFCSMIIHCHAMLDKPRDATHLGKIAKETGLECDLATIVETHKKIAIIRNNAIGHRSRQQSYSDSFKDAGVTAQEIEAYIRGCHRVVSAICEHLHIRSPVLNDLPAQHLNALITGNWDSDDDWVSSF